LEFQARHLDLRSSTNDENVHLAELSEEQHPFRNNRISWGVLTSYFEISKSFEKWHLIRDNFLIRNFSSLITDFLVEKDQRIQNDDLGRNWHQWGNHRMFHFEVSISAPRLDLESKSQQILTLARARSIYDFQSLGAKTRAVPVDFSNGLDVKPVG
jgi:hypothetical protein